MVGIIQETTPCISLGPRPKHPQHGSLLLSHTRKASLVIVFTFCVPMEIMRYLACKVTNPTQTMVGYVCGSEIAAAIEDTER